MRNHTLVLAIAGVLAGSCGQKDTGGEQGEAGKKTEAAGEVVVAIAAEEGKGKVLQMTAGTSTWSAAAAGAKIGAGDRISVEADASAMIRLEGDDRIALGSDTSVGVLSSSEIALEKGEIWVDGALGGRAGGLMVKTKAGSLTMEGAFAAVSYDEKMLRASIVSGSARLRGEGGETLVAGGMEGVVDPEGRVSVVSIKDPAGLVSWTEGLRKALETPVAIETGEQVPGLGTMAAKAPNSAKLLPFDVLSQDVTVRIQDQIALTKIEQVFRNPTKQVVEGMYKFPVPAGARLTRYDMEIKGKMMRGEIVERERGRVIMKTVIKQFVDMMRDPALVEWESGSTFSTRIFPIQPGEKKRIVLSYMQAMSGAGGKYHYVLPVSAAGAGAATVPAFRLDATVTSSAGVPRVGTPLYASSARVEGGAARVGFEATDFRPAVDMVLEIEDPGRPEASLATYAASAGLADEDVPAAAGEEEAWGYFMMNLAPLIPTPEARQDQGGDWIMLVDTSQSRTSFDMEIQKRLVEAIASTLSGRDRVKVMAYDMSPRLMTGEWREPSRDLPGQMRAFLDALPPAGATNLAAALMEAAVQAEPGRPTRIILVGDGAATLGENRPGVLARWAGAVFKERASTVTTIGVGSSVDSLLFEEIARETGGKYHYVSSGQDLLGAAVGIVTGLRMPVLEAPRLTIEGLSAKDVHPDMLPNLAGGEELTVTGRYRGTGTLSVRLEGTLAGSPWQKEYTFDVGEAGRANTFVPVVWASERIDALTLAGDDKSIKEAVALSKRYSLPSRYTSFIVLENEQMYREFKVQEGGDRLEWDGTGEIEYQQAQEPGVDSEMDLDALASVGGATRSGPAPAAGMVKPSSPAKMKSAAAEEKAADDELVTLLGDGGGGGYYPGGGAWRCNTSPRYEATIDTMPVEMDAQAEKDLVDLRVKAEQEPLVRTHRQRLVAFLLRHGEYAKAREEVDRWRAMDQANPVVLGYLGDLARFSGDLPGALRIYSGVLDIKPEDEKTMKTLASYFESKRSWVEAHAFRVSLDLLGKGRASATALRAIAAANAGLWDDAKAAALQLVVQGKLGKGVKLDAGLRDAVLRIAAGEKPPLAVDAPSVISAASAKLAVELTWDGPADLDLWVATRQGKYIGPEEGGHLVEGKGGQTEVFYMDKPEKGRFEIQVVCADVGGCGTLAGKIKIRAHGKTKTIPFVLQEWSGTGVASIRIEKFLSRCAIY